MKITIPDVLPLLKEYYKKEGNACGGSLHIVLEDGNIKDRNVIWCQNRALEKEDKDGYKLAGLLLLMTKSQRYRLYSKHSF